MAGYPLRELSAAALYAWVLAHAPRPPSIDCPLLLGVSGGLDSMSLWHLVHAAGLPHAVSHINYGLRGVENVAEAELVAQTARARGTKLYLETPAFAPGPGLQLRARELRRAIWEPMLEDHAALLLAHHANDQAETILQRLARGTGPQGIAGIARVSGDYLRPFLEVSRATLAAFAKTASVAFVEDSSNGKLDYARNRLRHQVLGPLLQAEPRAVAGFCLSAKRQTELLEFARAQATGILEAARIAPKPDQVPFQTSPDYPTVIAGPFHRQRLAEVSGLSAFLGLWLGGSRYGADTLEAIAHALRDGAPHRRRFPSKSRSRCIVVAGEKVWEACRLDDPSAARQP